MHKFMSNFVANIPTKYLKNFNLDIGVIYNKTGVKSHGQICLFVQKLTPLTGLHGTGANPSFSSETQG
jgi:hypothetical protein